MLKELNLQLFASLDDVIANNADAFGEGDTTQTNFEAISTKLKEMGYDVLINHRENAEFIPSSRLSEVVSQREAFKSQAETALQQLNTLKGQKGLSEEAQTQISGLISQNETLLKELQETTIQLEIMSNASDAICPADILPFINMGAIKLDKSGKPVSGVSEEVERVRAEKPYLFGEKQGNKGQKGGYDPNEGKGGAGGGKADMNAAIRRAAFGGSRTF